MLKDMGAADMLLGERVRALLCALCKGEWAVLCIIMCILCKREHGPCYARCARFATRIETCVKTGHLPHAALTFAWHLVTFSLLVWTDYSRNRF